MSTPTRPAAYPDEPADRNLLRFQVRPPLTVADTQWNRWLVWRIDQRALDAIHADYRAKLAAVAERRRA